MQKNILILTSEFPPQPGGIGNHAYHLAKGLHENGYKVSLICDQRSDSGQEEKTFDAKTPFTIVRIRRRRFILLSYLSRIRAAFVMGREANTVVASGKFSLWLGALCGVFIKSRYIAIVHGSEIKLPNGLLRRLTQISLKRYHTVIAVSNYTKSLMAALSLKDVRVIPNGFKIHMPEVAIAKKDPMPVLITVGNVSKRKGQQNVIAALPTILEKYPDLQYHIVGIPSLKPKLEKLALHLEVEKSVIFHGRVSDKVKQDLLRQSDVFIMLSEKTQKGDVEGFGIAILEANALGIPAIGATGCGIEDAIMDGVSGKLVDPKDPKQILKALDAVLNRYPEYAEGAKSWSNDFTWEKIIQQYLSVFKG